MNEGEAYAERWVEAWNSHALDRALALWADDLEFESPLALEITGSPVIRSKAAAAEYWGSALEQVSNLKFELQHVYWDPAKRAVTIIYRRERGDNVRTAAEVVKLNKSGVGVHGVALHGAVMNRRANHGASGTPH